MMMTFSDYVNTKGDLDLFYKVAYSLALRSSLLVHTYTHTHTHTLTLTHSTHTHIHTHTLTL